MTSLTDDALIVIICLVFFLILSLITNGVFFSVTLYKNLRLNRKPPKELPDAKDPNKEHSYEQMHSTGEISPYYTKMADTKETITPYYTKIGDIKLENIPKGASKDPSQYANLSNVPKSN